MFRYIRNKLLRLYKRIRFKITKTYIVYLCGPMTEVVDACNVWRIDVKNKFKNCNVKFINPVEEEKKKTVFFIVVLIAVTVFPLGGTDLDDSAGSLEIVYSVLCFLA